MRLSCSASAFFSSSATSSIASFATYSTSFSLIFMSKRNLLNPWCRPGCVHLGQQLRSNFDELPAPCQVGNLDDDTRTVHRGDAHYFSQLSSDQRWPELAEHLQVKFR